MSLCVNFPFAADDEKGESPPQGPGPNSVGLSNILDSELKRRKPTERSHGEVV